MKVFIPIDKTSHLKDLSSYNNNYYKLPIWVEECNIIYEPYDGVENFMNFELGILDGEGKFVSKLYLHTSPNQFGFDIDSKKLSEKNSWT